jgi:hypothetical protein
VQGHPPSDIGVRRNGPLAIDALDAERLAAVDDGQLDVLIGGLVKILHVVRRGLPEAASPGGEHPDLPETHADAIAAAWQTLEGAHPVSSPRSRRTVDGGIPVDAAISDNEREGSSAVKQSRIANTLLATLTPGRPVVRATARLSSIGSETAARPAVQPGGRMEGPHLTIPIGAPENVLTSAVRARYVAPCVTRRAIVGIRPVARRTPFTLRCKWTDGLPFSSMRRHV